jgi:hypothetical protein
MSSKLDRLFEQDDTVIALKKIIAARDTSEEVRQEAINMLHNMECNKAQVVYDVPSILPKRSAE